MTEISAETWQERYSRFHQNRAVIRSEAPMLATASMLDDIQARLIRIEAKVDRLLETMGNTHSKPESAGISVSSPSPVEAVIEGGEHPDCPTCGRQIIGLKFETVEDANAFADALLAALDREREGS